METLDACGLACPEPVLMLKSALNTQDSLVLLIDTKIAVENCTKYAKSQGFTVTVESEGETFKLHIAK